MPSKRFLLTLVVLLIPALTGSQCVFVATSGDGNPCKPTTDRTCNSQNNPPPAGVIAVDTGRFIDAPVRGLRYESGSITGITGEDGRFRYETGKSIRFFIGDIALGETAKGKSVITPLDLVPNGSIDTPAVINIARLLQSLDSTPDDERITIPAVVHTAAARSNGAASASIQYLDYADEATFVNTAAQLVSTLTASYPFTATLVDKNGAREHLARGLAAAGIFPGHSP
jgi:para-nitrobenzyl esterase